MDCPRFYSHVGTKLTSEIFKISMIVADFNQQRQRDYIPQEWDQIVAKKLLLHRFEN